MTKGMAVTHKGSAPLSFAHVTEALEGLRPSFSAHVRFGEHGAPVQNQRQWLRDEIRQLQFQSNLDKSVLPISRQVATISLRNCRLLAAAVTGG